MRDRDVLFVTRKFPPAVGGMENLSFEYARSLQAVAPTRVIALGRSQRNLVWFLPLAALRTFRAVVLGRVATVFVSDALMFVAIWPVLVLRRVRVVVSVNGLDLTYPRTWYRALVRRALRRADIVIAISRATADEARAAGVDPARITIIHPGLPIPHVDDATRTAAREAVRARAGLSDGDVVVATLGRLVRRKGQAWFAREALPRLPAQYRYVVAGTGPDLPELIDAARRAGVEGRCIVLGEVDDAIREAVLAGSDVFVAPNVDIPGDMEGFGIVAAEAAVRGTPVVAARLEGLRDAVIEGDLGVLCEPGDAAAFAAAVRAVVERDLASEQRKHASSRAADAFGVDRFDREVAATVRIDAPPDIDRRSHAVLDPASRRRKARKLIAIVERRRPLVGVALLEVGTGSGVMASALADAVGWNGSVHSVDVRDERVERGGYTFVEVTDTALPFPDATFDVAVSNHVFEHVGDRHEQLRHLTELHRVLKPDGIVYFATPNRHGLLEPHYRLPMLSWLPPHWANRYVRATHRGDIYDVVLPTRKELNALAHQAGFDAEECSIEAARVLAELEDPSFATRAVARLPRAVLQCGLVIVPTMVFLLRRTRMVAPGCHDEGHLPGTGSP